MVSWDTGVVAKITLFEQIKDQGSHIEIWITLKFNNTFARVLREED